MNRRRLLIAAFTALLVAWPLAGAIAEEAAPVASSVPAPGHLNLAAMTLDQADLPAGYRQLRYDDEGYTPGDRMALIQVGDEAETAAIAATEIAWFYSSTFQAEDGSSSIYVYLEEYPSEEAVAAGFAYFEDECAPPDCLTEGGMEVHDLPGPTAGEAPKETTVGSYPDWDDPTQTRRFVDASFRVGRVRAGVTVETLGDIPPDPALVEELAATLAGRIEAVLAAQAPPGIDLGLPTRMLPLFETWPWPGNSLEGYKSADEFLGPRGAAAQFAADYRSGYARFASVGSVPEIMSHTPPYIQLEVAEFASPAAALRVLGVAEELPPRHAGSQPTRDAAPSPASLGVDQVRAFHTSRVGPEEPPLPPLPGYELVFALGSRLIVVTVEVDVPDRTAALAQAEAAAVALATQQADCLRADEPCGPVQVPAALAVSATPMTGASTP